MHIRPPSSYATLCTARCAHELFLLLHSIEHIQPGACIYVMSDKGTRTYIERSSPLITQLEINWITNQDMELFSRMTRQQMSNWKTKKGTNLWSEFQMMKAKILRKGIQQKGDCLFVDCDMLFLNLPNVDTSKQLGVTDHYNTAELTAKYGRFNGGMLWSNQESVCDKWYEITMTKSRFYDQASIEDLYEIYDSYVMGPQYNFQYYRFTQTPNQSRDQVMKRFSVSPKDRQILFDNIPLISIHTHFKTRCPENQFFMELLKGSHQFKLVALVLRSIKDKWIINIPKIPQHYPNFWNHKNDSFRELALVEWNQRFDDFKVHYRDDILNCSLFDEFLLYDRPNVEHLIKDGTPARSRYICCLLGNGRWNGEEGKLIANQLKIPVYPWIFWGRRLSKLYQTEPKMERETNCIFIGNIENNTQETYRKSEWSTICDKYYCTKGAQHKFTQDEYLEEISKSKFGLCMRGYGPKCHREIEYMWLGVVPIINEDVDFASYHEKPIENQHYLYGKTPEDAKEKMDKITPCQWKWMSTQCREWAQRNVSIEGSWKTTIESFCIMSYE